MEEVKPTDADWKKYEKEIHNNLKSKFSDCEISYDDSIFGHFSKVDRQIDISFRGSVAGNKILGIVDCKYYSENIDVKAVEGFLGMLEYVNANIGIMITNKGYSEAAINRAKVKNLNLEVVKVEEFENLNIDYDEIINKKISNLRLSKFEFFKRFSNNWIQFDKEKSNYKKRIIVFKEGFANTEYYAFKKTIKESARIFRDFAELGKIIIRIPAYRNDESTNWKDELRIYECSITKNELELYLNLDFLELRQDIKKWRSEFLENPNYRKQDILDFAEKYISSKKVKNR